MADIVCRASDCGMIFSNKYILKQHEGLMHKNLIDETIEKIIEKIIKTHQPVDLTKKIVYIGSKKVSYREIADMSRDSDDFSHVKKIFGAFAENWLEANENKTVGDLLKTVKFNIK